MHDWLQAPHRPVRALGFAPAAAGVYVSRWHHGSPAHRYSLYALHWLTQLNGLPVPDLDAFVAIVKTLPDRSFARLKLCQLETTKTKVGILACCVFAYSWRLPRQKSLFNPGTVWHSFLTKGNSDLSDGAMRISY